MNDSLILASIMIAALVILLPLFFHLTKYLGARSDNGNRPAMDPINKDQNMTYNLNTDFGVDIVEFGGNCGSNETISFDHMGRPIVGDLSTHNTVTDLNLTTANCHIHLSDGTEDINITIEEETGYISMQ